MKKKVLFTTNLPAPCSVEFFNNLAQFYDLTVIFERTNAADRDKSWERYGAVQFEPIFLSGILVGNEFAFCPSIVSYLREKKYDQIIIGDYSSPTGIYAILFMHVCHMDFLIHADGGIIGADSKSKYLLKKYLLSKAGGYMSPGDLTDKYFRYYGDKEKPIYRFPFTSVSKKDIVSTVLKKEEKKRLRKNLGMADTLADSYLVLSVGQIIPRKGYDILLNAAAKINKNIQILIIGGKATEELSNIINLRKLNNVYFMECIPHGHVCEYMKAADLFVLPTRYDIWGLVINEAMASGLPVITTTRCVSGMELVENGKNGYVIEPENIEALSYTINVMAEMAPDMQYAMGQHSILKIHEYTIENMAVQYAKEVNNYIESRQ